MCLCVCVRPLLFTFDLQQGHNSTADSEQTEKMPFMSEILFSKIAAYDIKTGKKRQAAPGFLFFFPGREDGERSWQLMSASDFRSQSKLLIFIIKSVCAEVSTWSVSLMDAHNLSSTKMAFA